MTLFRLLQIYLSLIPLSFIHRYAPSFTIFGVNITLNIMYFVIPFLIISIVFWYLRDHNITALLNDLIAFFQRYRTLHLLLGSLVASIFLSYLTNYKTASLGATIRYIVPFLIYLFSTFIWFLWARWQDKETTHKKNLNTDKFRSFQRIIIKILKSWFVVFILSLVLSIYQLFDCWTNACSNVTLIQRFFTPNALPFKQQVFTYLKTENILVRPPGIFGDTAFFVGFLILWGTVLLILWTTTETVHNLSKTIPYKIFPYPPRLMLVLLFTTLVLILLAASRSPYVGALVFLPVIGLLLLKYPKKVGSLILGTFLISIALLYIVIKAYQPAANYIAHRINIVKDPSALHHAEIYDRTVQIIKHMGLKAFGYGPLSYTRLLKEEFPKLQVPTGKMADPHSEPLKFLIELGYISSLIYVAFLIYISYQALAWLKIFKDFRPNKTENTSRTMSMNFYLRLSLIMYIINIMPVFWGLTTTIYYGIFMPHVWAFGLVPIELLNKSTYKNKI